MRVLQLIDSLAPGGAERMAVTIANSLKPYVDRSYLVTTRKEGALKASLDPSVGYLFLKKERSLDVQALRKLYTFVSKEKITHVHAHTTSYFLGTQLKILRPNIQLIWHEHHGKRAETEGKEHRVLRLCSRRFQTIITVSEALETWCKEQLRCSQVTYLPNFVSDDSFTSENNKRPKKIICLANLRAPKNHLNLLQAFQSIAADFPDWQLLLVGTDYRDRYSEAIQSFIANHHLQSQINVMGRRDDVQELLRTAAIGVLSSDHEGLPMALLEYGAAGLAVVATAVGQTSKVISTFGHVVPKNTPDALATALRVLMNDPSGRQEYASAYQKHIQQQYSAAAIMPQLMKQYSS